MSVTSFPTLEIQPVPVPVLLPQPPSIQSLTLADIRVFLHCAMQAGPLCSGRIPRPEMDEHVRRCDARYPDLDADLLPALQQLSVQETVSDDTLDAHAVIFTWEPMDTSPSGSAVRAAARAVIVAFRGTSSRRNVVTDAEFGLVRLRSTSSSTGERSTEENHLRARAKVHAGFQKALAAIVDRVIHEIVRSGCSHVWLLGHSLGGALATLLATEVSAVHPCIIGVCTFGAPPVGNRSYVELFERKVAVSIRVVNEDDPIPWSLPQLFGFRHADGLVRVSPCGHFVVLPGFIEEALRKHVHRTTVVPFFPYYCCRCRYHAKKHLGVDYAHSLRKAQSAEVSALEFLSRLQAESFMPRTTSSGIQF